MTRSVSPLIAFYRGDAVDAAGRTITDIWSFDHRRLEMVHDFIQWLFPLPDPSRFNPDAPLLTAADKAAFRADPHLQDRVRRSLDLMLDFLGLKREGGVIMRGAAFAHAYWLEPANHNHLRLTRIMLFLGHAGLQAEAAALLACLEDIAAHEGAGKILPRTLDFWRASASG
ncbi:MAG: hypothetical protein K2P94_01895 [Rhodospirillaceae bacterium]|nr:hypothetical protein [Rhodospirillaceae bacterium]